MPRLGPEKRAVFSALHAACVRESLRAPTCCGSRGGRLVEVWNQWDGLSVVEQLK